MTALLAAWRWLPDSVKRIGGIALGVFALVVALLYAHDRHDTRLIAQGRAEILREATTQIVWPAERAAWKRREDSLRRVLAQRDTALVASIAKVRELLKAPRIPLAMPLSPSPRTASSSGAVPPLTNPRPTPLTFAAPTHVQDDSLHRACSALANDCEAFRITAQRAFAVADSMRHADSTAIRALSVGLVASRESFARAVKWRGIERGVCAASVGFNVLQWATR